MVGDPENGERNKQLRQGKKEIWREGSRGRITTLGDIIARVLIPGHEYSDSKGVLRKYCSWRPRNL